MWIGFIFTMTVAASCDRANGSPGSIKGGEFIE
jgi:hypothetical protein